MSQNKAQDKEFPSADAYTYADIKEARIEEVLHPDIGVEPEAERVTAEVAAAIAIASIETKKEDEEPATPCYGMSDLFFPTNPAETKTQREARVHRAKSICSHCELKAACLEGALARREEWGVWGGEELSKGRIV